MPIPLDAVTLRTPLSNLQRSQLNYTHLPLSYRPVFN